jgi:hypothetical protein
MLKESVPLATHLLDEVRSEERAPISIGLDFARGTEGDEGGGACVYFHDLNPRSLVLAYRSLCALKPYPVTDHRLVLLARLLVFAIRGFVRKPKSTVGRWVIHF